MCQSFSLSLYHLYFSLILLLLSAQLSPKAFSGGPRDAGKKSRGCLSLKIGHSRNELPGQTPQPVVTARLLNTSTHPVECYTPGAKHFVQLEVHGTNHKIKGLAISAMKPCGRLGLESDTIGRFSPERPLRWWLTCPNTVTQNMVLGGGAGVKEVSIVWKAPSMSSQSAMFVYSVVFTQYEWLDELKSTFPSCVPPCVRVPQNKSTNTSAAVANSTLDDPQQAMPDECKPSIASETLVRCGALTSFPKECSVPRGRFISAQTPSQTRDFTRHHHPSSTLECARTDCHC